MTHMNKRNYTRTAEFTRIRFAIREVHQKIWEIGIPRGCIADKYYADPVQLARILELLKNNYQGIIARENANQLISDLWED